MSNMLEQAIIDAQSLREAAIKNAESEIVEKYSDEVKEAVTKLLEQEDEELDLGLDDEGETDSTAMEQVPMAHVSDGAIDESELLDLFKELLVLDVPEKAVEDSMEEISRDEVETDEEEVSQDSNVSMERVEGMDKEDSEEYLKTKEKNESLNKENKKLRGLLESLKDKLEELHTQNARLLYTNRVYENTSLNERQKNRIVEMVSNARSVDEARVIFETLQKTMASIAEKTAPKSLSEAVTKRSSVVLSSRREEPVSQQSPTTDRWAILAGLKDK
jgi:hypothetical protein